jgi:hypothetical protein
MDNIFNKFIIETDKVLGDCLILGRVTYHKQLAFDIEKVKSGGWWRKKDGRITFFGNSSDFGATTQEQVSAAVMNNKIFTSYILEHPINKDYKFSYDKQSEIVKLT